MFRYRPLDPCPFCDGDATLRQTIDDSWWVTCHNDECKANCGYFDRPEDAFQAWQRRGALHVSVKSGSAVTLYREIDALGGTGEGERHAGYSEALDDVLAILFRRGFSEQSDAPVAPLRTAIDKLERRDGHEGYDADGNFLYAEFVRLDDVRAVFDGRVQA